MAANSQIGNNYTYTCSNGAFDSNDLLGNENQNNMIYTSQAAAYPYQMIDEINTQRESHPKDGHN